MAEERGFLCGSWEPQAAVAPGSVRRAAVADIARVFVCATSLLPCSARFRGLIFFLGELNPGPAV